MKKTDLTSRTVAELNALAKKNKVAMPAKAKKAEIVELLLAADARKVKASGKSGAAVAVKKASAKKPAAKITAAKKTASKKTASSKIASRKTAANKTATALGAGKRLEPVSKKQAAVRKTRPVVSSVREWKLPPGAEEPLMAQERVAESKYYTGPELMSPVSDSGELPRGYHEERIAILSRDPYVAYAYWEATPARIEREKTWFGWDSKLCVRIYDITGVQFDGRNAIGYFDQEIVDRIGSWYFDFGRPTHSFCADLGLMTPEGRFLTIARSNYITMPRDGISDVIDEEWMLVDEEFWQLYGYPEGFRQGVSSPEMQEMLKRRRALEISSPGQFSRDRAKRK